MWQQAALSQAGMHFVPHLPRWPCAVQEGDESIDHPEPPGERARLGADKAEDSILLQPF